MYRPPKPIWQIEPTDGPSHMFHSMWVDPLALNGQFHRNMEALMRGWQLFVQHRIRENTEFAERLQVCTQPVQIWSAYQEFWAKTAENVGKDITAITKEMSEAASANPSVATTRKSDA